MDEYNINPDKGKNKSRRSTRAPRTVEIRTPLQLHDLGLLKRVLAAQNSYETHDDRDPWLLHAINRAVYAAYVDCIDEGVGESAKEILRTKLSLN